MNEPQDSTVAGELNNESQAPIQVGEVIEAYGLSDDAKAPGVPKKPLRNTTYKEKGYIKSIASGMTKRDAVRANYNMKPGGSVKTLDRMAEKIEARPSVMALLQANEALAQSTVVDVMTVAMDYGRGGGKDGASYARVALDGANSLLDRIHGKATQRVDVKQETVNFNVSLKG